MKELAQIPYQAIRGTQLADGAWKYQMWTPELLPEQVAAMAELSSKPGWFVCKPNELTIEDIPVGDAPVEQDVRTPSQQLRGRIYRLWESMGSEGDFESYYRQIMHKFIETINRRLEP